MGGRKRCRGRRLKSVDRAKISLDSRKLVVLVPIYFSFIVGVFIGGYVCMTFDLEAKTFLVPAALNGTLGVLYRLTYSTVKARLKKLKKMGTADVDVEDSEDDSRESQDDTEEDESATDEDGTAEEAQGVRSIRRTQ